MTTSSESFNIEILTVCFENNYKENNTSFEIIFNSCLDGVTSLGIIFLEQFANHTCNRSFSSFLPGENGTTQTDISAFCQETKRLLKLKVKKIILRSITQMPQPEKKAIKV